MTLHSLGPRDDALRSSQYSFRTSYRADGSAHDLTCRLQHFWKCTRMQTLALRLDQHFFFLYNKLKKILALTWFGSRDTDTMLRHLLHTEQIHEFVCRAKA